MNLKLIKIHNYPSQFPNPYLPITELHRYFPMLQQYEPEFWKTHSHRQMSFNVFFSFETSISKVFRVLANPIHSSTSLHLILNTYDMFPLTWTPLYQSCNDAFSLLSKRKFSHLKLPTFLSASPELKIKLFNG